MDLFRLYLLPCLFAFLAGAAFCFIFNLRGRMLLLAPLGAAVGWLVYLLAAPLSGDISRSFVATLAAAAYGEVMARVCKQPATGFILVGLLPFVPGGGIYYTMEHCIAGEIDLFITTGIHTLGVAGALAAGVLLVSSFMRLWGAARHHFRRTLSHKGGST